MPGQPLPFELTVFDKSYTKRGPLGAVLSLDGEAVHNGAGSVEFTVPAGHPRMADLTADGARVVCTYRPTSDRSVHMISGPVEQTTGGGGRRPWRRFKILDDWSVLTDEVQCWPNPTGTVDQQGDDEAYHTVTGPAETVLKDIVRPNVVRDGLTLTIPASAGLGASITGSVRFHTPAERLFPAVTRAGIGVRVRQVEGGRELQVWVPATRTRVLTQESGVVVSGEYSVKRPTVTRVVVLGPGEGTARVVRRKIDAAREAAFGVRLPKTVDARDIKADDPNIEGLLLARMDQALAEGAPKASLKCELVETQSFRLGLAYDLGDLVPVRLADGPTITDRVSAVAYSWKPGDGGVRITPRIGEWADTADAALVAQVVALTRSVSNLEKR
jgi:hypothetical protein